MYKGQSLILFKPVCWEQVLSASWVNVNLFHSSLYYILSYMGPTCKLNQKIEDILKIWKENQHEKLKIIDLLRNWCSVMICMVQAWRGVVERSLGLETSLLGYEPWFCHLKTLLWQFVKWGSDNGLAHEDQMRYEKLFCKSWDTSKTEFRGGI